MPVLGLAHIFDLSAQYVFNKGTTDNYMDYNNTAKHTFMWQWQLLHRNTLTI